MRNPDDAYDAWAEQQAIAAKEEPAEPPLLDLDALERLARGVPAYMQMLKPDEVLRLIAALRQAQAERDELLADGVGLIEEAAESEARLRAENERLRESLKNISGPF